MTHNFSSNCDWVREKFNLPITAMVGTDTWIPGRWERLPEILDDVRGWLRALPRGVSERMAFGNAERLIQP